MLIELKLKAIGIDETAGVPVIILENDKHDTIPIWVNVFEGSCLIKSIYNEKSSRPLTYDLIVKLLEIQKLELKKVVITDIIDNVFYSLIVLKNNNNEIIEIDSRPSDSINIATMLKKPIFIKEELIERIPINFKNKDYDITEEDFKEI